MQAIQTKYHGPTNTKGSKITARAEAGSVSVSYDHALNGQENHREAARALVAKLGWADHGQWHGGQLPDGSYAWTCANGWAGCTFNG